MLRACFDQSFSKHALFLCMDLERENRANFDKINKQQLEITGGSFQ